MLPQARRAQAKPADDPKCIEGKAHKRCQAVDAIQSSHGRQISPQPREPDFHFEFFLLPEKDHSRSCGNGHQPQPGKNADKMQGKYGAGHGGGHSDAAERPGAGPPSAE